MQAFLTVAAEFVAVAGFALFAFQFVSGLLDRRRPIAVPDVLIDTDELAAELARIAAEVFAETEAEAAPTPIADAVVPFTRKAPSLDRLSIRELKAVASRVKMPRYNKLTKAELAERLLSEVPLWRLKEAIAV